MSQIPPSSWGDQPQEREDAAAAPLIPPSAETASPEEQQGDHPAEGSYTDAPADGGAPGAPPNTAGHTPWPPDAGYGQTLPHSGYAPQQGAPYASPPPPPPAIRPACAATAAAAIPRLRRRRLGSRPPRTADTVKVRPPITASSRIRALSTDGTPRRTAVSPATRKRHTATASQIPANSRTATANPPRANRPTPMGSPAMANRPTASRAMANRPTRSPATGSHPTANIPGCPASHPPTAGAAPATRGRTAIRTTDRAARELRVSRRRLHPRRSDRGHTCADSECCGGTWQFRRLQLGRRSRIYVRHIADRGIVRSDHRDAHHEDPRRRRRQPHLPCWLWKGRRPYGGSPLDRDHLRRRPARRPPMAAVGPDEPDTPRQGGRDGRRPQVSALGRN